MMAVRTAWSPLAGLTGSMKLFGWLCCGKGTAALHCWQGTATDIERCYTSTLGWTLPSCCECAVIGPLSHIAKFKGSQCRPGFEGLSNNALHHPHSIMHPQRNSSPVSATGAGRGAVPPRSAARGAAWPTCPPPASWAWRWMGARWTTGPPTRGLPLRTAPRRRAPRSGWRRCSGAARAWQVRRRVAEGRVHPVLLAVTGGRQQRPRLDACLALSRGGLKLAALQQALAETPSPS